MRSKIESIAAVGALGFALFAATGVSAQVWDNPTAAPTGGNAAAPINVSSVTQTKAGVLNVSGLRSYVDLIADGKIGIGTVSPSGKLGINGYSGNSTIVQLTNGHDGIATRLIGRFGTHHAGYVWGTETSSPTPFGFGFDYSGNPLIGNLSSGASAVFVNKSNFNVGVGTVGPAYKLDVSGSVGATAFFYTSDKSLKKDLRPLEGSLEKIQRLEGVSFSWKNDGRKSLGLVAQDVESVYPELVHTTDAGLKSVEYGNLVAPLIEAIKEQQRQIEELKREVAELKAVK